ncbi:unnamed protein product, partial [Acidithrix sp. C25]
VARSYRPIDLCGIEFCPATNNGFSVESRVQFERGNPRVTNDEAIDRATSIKDGHEGLHG